MTVTRLDPYQETLLETAKFAPVLVKTERGRQTADSLVLAGLLSQSAYRPELYAVTPAGRDWVDTP